MSAASLFDLTGRRALVTGGGSGLGLAIAEGLAGAGAKVVLNGRDATKLEAAARRLRGSGAAVHTRAFDVADPEAAEAGVRAVESDLGGIDILVNNAGMMIRGAIDGYATREWRSLMALNVDAPFYVTRAALPGMKARRSGKIINVCSLQSFVARAGTVAYAASKGALAMLTRGLAAELAPFDIQVNGIAPGFYRTDMNADLYRDAGFDAWVRRRTPAARWGEPRELAGVAVFLAAPASSFVTGQIVCVDGGFSAAM